MTLAEEQRNAETLEQIRSYVYRHCHRMTAQEIATELGISLRIVDLWYPRASR